MTDYNNIHGVKLSGAGNAGEAGLWLAIALLIIFCYGSPDLLDCIKFKLLDGNPAAQTIVLPVINKDVLKAEAKTE